MSAETISLAGHWQFALDPQNQGVSERWFARKLPQTLNLPGGLTEQGFGDPITVDTHWMGGIFDRSFFTEPEYAKYREPGNIKVPFWLQPEKYYAGAAWYRKSIHVPRNWAGRRLELILERPHWETHVWLDDREIGVNRSLSVPHVYDLGTQIAAGEHTLTVRIDNSLVVDIGTNSHSITDHTQGNWNGVVGKIELRAVALPSVADVQVYPDVLKKSVRVKGRIEFAPTNAAPVAVKIAVHTRKSHAPAGSPVTVRTNEAGVFETEYSLGPQAQPWDEFQPALYEAIVKLPNGESTTTVFGLREVSTVGTQIAVNGRPIFLRGTLECAIFPKTGHPPSDVESWRHVLQVARAHGLNHLRFHSWCPPEAAFEAGDELGFYFQIEIASWPNFSTTLGDGKPVDAWIMEERDRILAAYGNHPSFLLLSTCNEPGGNEANAFLAKFVSENRARDSRRLYTSGSGWPQIPENQYHIAFEPRIQHWGAGLKSRINAHPPETMTDYESYINERSVPVVSHEIGQWCVYPDFAEIAKYTGYLKAKNFEIFRATLAEHHLSDQAHAFLIASGKLQALCYKEEIESALRTRGMAGIQLLDLHDFPGQGTALVGVLNPFWESKGYITADEYRKFCDSTVLLARMPQRVFYVGDKLSVRLEIAHYGPKNLQGARVTWQVVTESGKTIGRGEVSPATIPTGTLTELGTVEIDFTPAAAPARCRLVMRLENSAIENSWNLWVYPKTSDTATPSGVKLATELDEAALAALEHGDTVFLQLPALKVGFGGKHHVELGFSSIFWNTAWTNGQAPHALGILCDPKHPALAGFPTEFHSDWQWWYPISKAGAMVMDGLPADLRPIVQVIDDWFTNRRLGLVFEARMGHGKLLVTSIDFAHADDPVNRQLYASLVNYVASRHFAPKVAVTKEQLQTLTREVQSP